MNNSVMLLTGSGAAAVAVVRISGPEVEAFLLRHFSRRAHPARCVHGDIVDGTRVLDDAVVVIDPQRRWADVNVHGGPWVVHSVLELARSCGFTMVDAMSADMPPEALDAAGDLELEVMRAIPRAPTREALRLLLAQAEQWGGLMELPPEDRRERAGAILADQTLRAMLSLPRVAIVGPANVGKSTLANQLFAQERSITADMPGTTRDWVGEVANLDGLAVMLVDTPGLRTTDDAIEREAIARSAGQVAEADLVVLVLDGSREADAEERVMMARFEGALLVLNKVDLGDAMAHSVGGVADPASRVAGSTTPTTAPPSAIRTVATAGEGVDALRAAIRGRLGCGDMTTLRPLWWTQRQRQLLAGM